jgi:hypothetical protein
LKQTGKKKKMTSVEDIEKWLNNHSNKMDRAKQKRKLNPNLPPPSSYMSLFPELIALNDPELDPIRLITFLEQEKGVGQVPSDDIPSRNLEINDTKQLIAAFSLQPEPIVEDRKRPTSSIHPVNKRLRLDSNRSLSPIPPSPIPFSESSVASDQLTPLPPLPPGPPPPSRKRAASLTEMEDDVESNLEVEIGLPSTSPALRKELLRLVQELIKLDDWPRSVRTMIRAFKECGYANGNPFITISIQSKQSISLEASNERAKLSPIDLKTILGNVLDDRYIWFYQLEADLRRLVTQIQTLYTVEGPMKVIAKHFADQVDIEIEKSYKSLEKIST